MPHPHVSIITPSVDGWHHLEPFLESVYAQDYPREQYDVIVVDNGSSDGTAERLGRRFPDVEVISNPENVGFAAANNQGARAARGRYLALLNNDMRLEPSWLRTMVGFADAAPAETVCIGSPILSWDGSTIDFIDAAMSFDGFGFQPHRGESADFTQRHLAPDELLFAPGAAMLIERETYQEVGGFDDDYFAYYEDVDLGWRLWVLGYRIGLCPDAVVYHRRNASQPAGRHRTSYLLDRNALYSTIKNYDDDSLAVVLPAALMLACVRSVSRSGISREALRPGSTGAATTGLIGRLHRTWRGPSGLEALASVAAIDEVAEQLPRMLEKRRWIQERRRRADSEIVRLFKTPFPSSQSRAVAEMLGVADHFESLLGREPVAEPS
jgi:GT2 family glycosyltransferase